MTCRQELCASLWGGVRVHLTVALGGEVVEDHEEEVETGEEGVGEVDVAREGLVLVVGAVERIRGRHDAAARIQRCLDPRLGDRHRLLLHHLEKRGPGAVSARSCLCESGHLLAKACV